MTTWTLVVFVFMGTNSGISSVKIEGYIDQRSCEEAIPYATKQFKATRGWAEYKPQTRALCIPVKKGNQ